MRRPVCEIINYHEECEDGQDFRPSQPYFCEKCNHKGTILKRIIDSTAGTSFTIAQDCQCKIEYISNLKLKQIGVYPEYRSLNLDEELNEKTKQFLDKYYDCYKQKIYTKNLLITGKKIPKKTKLISLFIKYFLYKNLNLNIKYVTMYDLLVQINKIWNTGDYTEIESYGEYDFLVIDKMELGLNLIKQNMNVATFCSIIDQRIRNEKPTIISCATSSDLEILNLDIEMFTVKDLT